MSSIQYWLGDSPGSNNGVFLTVEYAYFPAVPNLKEAGSGLALTPEEPPEVEIISIRDEQGRDYTLSESDMDMIVEDCFRDVEHRQCDAAIVQAELEAEYMRERRNSFAPDSP